MARPTVPLGDFERANILQSWALGLTTSEAVRAWVRAPNSDLLESDRAQQAYFRAGTDEVGRPMPTALKGLVQFIGRANLGCVAVRIGRRSDGEQDPNHGEPNYVVVRHPRQPTWIALIEEWNHGITIYSRWDCVATVNIAHAPSDEDFASIVRAAQRLSTRRPATSTSGSEWVDPVNPAILRDGEERVVQPPDLIDRVVGWVRNFW